MSGIEEHNICCGQYLLWQGRLLFFTPNRNAELVMQLEALMYVILGYLSVDLRCKSYTRTSRSENLSDLRIEILVRLLM